MLWGLKLPVRFSVDKTDAFAEGWPRLISHATDATQAKRASPWALHKLGDPIEELGYRSSKDTITICIRSLCPVQKDGAFRGRAVNINPF
jgi:hypothetical protein